MSDRDLAGNTGWSIGQSIAIELHVVLSAIQGYFAIAGLPEDVVALLDALPADWQDELPTMLGSTRRLFSIMGLAARLAGVMLDGDYGRATMAMRQLTVAEALDHAIGEAQNFGLEADANLPPPARLVALWLALQVALYADVGFTFDADNPILYRERRNIEQVVRILRDGDLNARFWHWLDRFYYGYYQPWREAHTEKLEALEARAITALGARERWGEPPEMAWLSELSPLHTHPELATAVRDGRLRVVFWVEPFGMSDLWSLQPGLLLLSFAEPGVLYQNFRAFAADVAARAKALGDPTRLIILRMIRHFGMINTEMANALGLARPTVSVHAKVLREAGLIRSHRQGREVRHELVPEEVLRLFNDLRDLLDLEEGDRDS